MESEIMLKLIEEMQNNTDKHPCNSPKIINVACKI